MEKLEKRESNLVSGGARGTTVETYKFHCKRCGHNWEEQTANPGDRHGCPKCGWWFMAEDGNRDANGDLKFDNECVEYSPASPKGPKSIKIKF